MSAKNLISFDTLSQGHPYFQDTDSRPDWQEIFANDHALKLEIGFGNGKFLIEMALLHPEHNFVGLDFYHKGIRKSITRIDKLAIKNICVAYGDARGKVPLLFNKGELEDVYINFPDPWPKKRHTKRRLVKPGFVDVLEEKLAGGGKVHLATDSKPYADEILACFEAAPNFKSMVGNGGMANSRQDLPKTKYENYFIKAGEDIYYLEFIKE